jgi:dTDP-glucose 4,6-dehydratase/UDP-glucuronate decarboxylase
MLFAKEPTQEMLKNQINTINLNTACINRLFPLLSRQGTFIYLSSSEVYQGLLAPFNESEIGNINPDHPRASYIHAKIAGETMCHIYKNLGYDVKIIRLCQCFGSGVKKNDTRVMNEFIKQGIENKHIEVKDSGISVKNYIYVNDALEMLIDIGFFGKDMTYNVGNDQSITIRSLAQMIAEMMDVSVSFNDNEKNIMAGAAPVMAVNMQKYEDEFGALYCLDLKESLRRIIKWWEWVYEQEEDKL